MPVSIPASLFLPNPATFRAHLCILPLITLVWHRTSSEEKSAWQRVWVPSSSLQLSGPFPATPNPRSKFRCAVRTHRLPLRRTTASESATDLAVSFFSLHLCTLGSFQGTCASCVPSSCICTTHVVSSKLGFCSVSQFVRSIHGLVPPSATWRRPRASWDRRVGHGTRSPRAGPCLCPHPTVGTPRWGTTSGGRPIRTYEGLQPRGEASGVRHGCLGRGRWPGKRGRMELEMTGTAREELKQVANQSSTTRQRWTSTRRYQDGVGRTTWERTPS